jgi:hypothetical protein
MSVGPDDDDHIDETLVELRKELAAWLAEHADAAAAYVRNVAAYCRFQDDERERRHKVWSQAATIGSLLDDPAPFKELVAAVKRRRGDEFGFDADDVHNHAKTRAPYVTQKLYELLGIDVPDELKPKTSAAAPGLLAPRLTTWTGEDFRMRAEPHPMVVPELLFAHELNMLVAEGASGKTTAALMIAIQLAAGDAVFGYASWRADPAKVLYITKEDRPWQLVQRIRILLGHLCGQHQDGTFASIADQQRFQRLTDAFAVRFAMLDLNGTAANLIERSSISQGGTYLGSRTTVQAMGRAPIVAQLRGVLDKVKPGLIIMDPLAPFLGDGENDNGYCSMVAEELRQLGIEYDAGTLALHHPSKAVARGDVLDQHALRGASSLSTGSRAIYQMHVTTARAFTVHGARYAFPEEVPNESLSARRVMALIQHKFTHGRTWDQPVRGLWRRHGLPLESVQLTRTTTDEREAARTAQTESDDARLAEWIAARCTPETPKTENAIRGEATVLGFGETRIRNALARLGDRLIKRRGRRYEEIIGIRPAPRNPERNSDGSEALF